MPFEVKFPDGTVIEGIPEGTSMEQVAARYEQETGRKAPPRTTAQAAPQAQPGFLQRNAERVVQGVSDAMSTVAGDSYGKGGDPTANRQEGLLGKTMSVAGSNIIPAVGDVIGDAIIEGGKAVLPEAGERAVADMARSVIQSDPVQAGMEAWGDFKEGNPDIARRVEQTVNIGSAFAPAAKAVPKTNIGTRAFKKSQANLKADRETLVGRMLQPDETADTARRTTVEGPLGRKTYSPTEAELATYKEVASIKDVKPKGSFTENRVAVDSEVKRMREELDSALEGTDVPTQDVQGSLIRAVNQVGKNPVLTGATGESAVRIYDIYADILNGYAKQGTISAKDLLQSRRDLDQQLQRYSKNIFDTSTSNAVKEANSAIRTAINNLVDEAAPDAGVHKSLEKQSRLLSARDVLAERSAKEAETSVGRLIDNLERSSGLRHPSTPLALQATASSPVVGIASATLAAGWGVKKALTKQTRQTYVRLLREVEKAINKGGPLADQMKADKAVLMALISQETED